MEDLQQMEARAIAAETRWATMLSEMSTICEGRTEEIRDDYTSGIDSGWHQAHAHLMTATPDLTAARDLIEKAATFARMSKQWVDAEHENITLRTRLRESEAMAERLRNAVQGLVTLRSQTDLIYEDAYGAMFKETGEKQWAEAQAVLDDTPAAILEQYRDEVLEKVAKHLDSIQVTAKGNAVSLHSYVAAEIRAMKAPEKGDTR